MSHFMIDPESVMKSSLSTQNLWLKGFGFPLKTTSTCTDWVLGGNCSVCCQQLVKTWHGNCWRDTKTPQWMKNWSLRATSMWRFTSGRNISVYTISSVCERLNPEHQGTNFLLEMENSAFLKNVIFVCSQRGWVKYQPLQADQITNVSGYHNKIR